MTIAIRYGLMLMRLVTMATPAFAQGSETSVDLDLYAGMTFGPHSVGFKAEAAMDSSQTYRLAETGGQLPGRPLQIAVWYPAGASGSGMTFQSYVVLKGEEIPSKPKDLAWSLQSFRKGLSWIGDEFNSASLKALMVTPVKATRGALPRQGSFPTVFFYGRGSVHANAPFCEFLASHGFVVVCLSALGTFTRESNGFDPLRKEALLRDFEFRMGYMAHHWPHADASRIAVISFSFHGTVAVLAAMKHPRIKAVITLDGYEMSSGGQGVFAQDPWYRPSDLQVPMLAFYSDMMWPGATPTFLTAHPFSERTFALIEDFHHFDFLTTGRFVQKGRTQAKMEKYTAVNEYSRLFLQAYLDPGKTPSKRLSAEILDAGPSGGKLALKRLAAKPGPLPTAEVFAAYASQSPPKFRALMEYGKTLSLQMPAYDETVLNFLAFRAARDKRHALAEFLYLWNRQAYPLSADAHANHGIYYANQGLRAEAEQALTKALDLNTNHRRAKMRLERLKRP